MTSLEQVKTESRIILYVFLLLTICWTCACSSQLRREAEAEAQKWFESTVVKCGDEYYISLIAARFVNISPSSDSLELYQLKNPHLRIREDEAPRTDADRLNGVEWKGHVFIDTSAYRHYLSDGQWSDWNDGTPAISWIDIDSNESGAIRAYIEKRNGKWETSSVGIEKPDCSKIPPIK